MAGIATAGPCVAVIVFMMVVLFGTIVCSTAISDACWRRLF